ncbi:MAG: substrate-binding domain-containing protein [Acetatifactor sp.]|nr:substrate-binding domain-containing protein [Acetatifactor sp.]
MSKRHLILILCLLTVGISTLLTWSRNTKDEALNANEGKVEYIIGVSQANMREKWRVALVEELEKEIQGYDNIRIITTDATSSVEKQKLDISHLMGFGIDLLIISPCDEKEMTEKIKEVYDSNIPVIVMDRAIEGFDYTLYIGPDNTVIGQQAGNYIAAMFDGKPGKVLELQGNNLPIQSEERSIGFASVMDAHPEIERSVLKLQNESKDSAYDAVLAAGEELKEVDAIFAHSDYIALGAYEALKNRGLENTIAIVGSDGFKEEDEGIDLVQSGRIEATISCPIGAREAIEYAMDILKNETGVPKQVILRSYTITQKNVENYLDKMNATYEDSGRKIVVGYSQVGQESQWRLANTNSIQTAADIFNIRLLLEDANQSQERQIEAIRGFIREGVDVIVVSPVVETGWDEVLREAKAAGIPVVMSDRNVTQEDIEEDLITTYIGADFKEEGRRAMRWIRDNVEPDKKQMKILQLQGNKGASPTEERQEGFEEVLKECPEYKIVYSDHGNFTFEGGQKIVREYLNQYKWDIDIIYAHNDDMALGAIEELKKHGIKPGEDVKIVSVDATKAAFLAMIEGELNCAVECNPVFGNQLMKAVRDLVSGKPMPFKIITEEKIYDESVAEDMIKLREY